MTHSSDTTFSAFATAFGGPDATFLDEGRLLRAVGDYLQPDDAAHVEQVLAYLHAVSDAQPDAEHDATLSDATTAPDASRRGLHGDSLRVARQPRAAFATAPAESLGDALSYAVAIAGTLADALHIDAVTLAAVLIYPLVKSGAISLAEMRSHLGNAFGEQVAHTLDSIERFDSLQRPGAALRRSAQAAQAEGDEVDRERRRSRERRRAQDADALRKMFLAVAEDPRVVIIKIADQLRLMRAARDAADLWRAHLGQPTSRPVGLVAASSAAAAPAHPAAASAEPFVAPPWTLEECRQMAQETQEVYAPLAARLGMGRVEGELHDLAFAVLEPAEYRWLDEAVEVEAQERRVYVDRVCATLRDEMRAVGINAEVSGRFKHLYSIYKKVKRSESRDLANLFDIVAFRIIVGTVEECYIALGHVHELWRPKDGRIKDFIAAPKPNGYQSLHTTVFCLDGRLAEIQIRTREMHQVAEYGVAMHWYYKDIGDAASAEARPLQAWIQQVQEWQNELQSAPSSGVRRALDAVKGDVLKEQIFLFTPAGDVKELPAGSTPIDFAYRIHSGLGDHVSGARITTDDGTARLVKRMVPLDYELKGGDVVEILSRADAHPTRDWLRFARTKAARAHITRYLKEHERDIDAQMGRERLDRELKLLGLRKGLEELSDDDLAGLAAELKQSDAEAMLVAIGRETLRMAEVLPTLRERLKPLLPEPELPTTGAARESETAANVAGLAGMLAHPGNCCYPLPGDELLGFITRGRGVVIHRTDCPNLRHLLAREPERAVPVEWAEPDGKQVLRAEILVEGADRTGLLRDVTGVIANSKINMLKVETITRERPRAAIIDAVLEIQRPEHLQEILRDLRAVRGVMLAERKLPGKGKGANGARPIGTSGAQGTGGKHGTNGANGKAGADRKRGRKG
jgi:GTP pyrophosphokinase